MHRSDDKLAALLSLTGESEGHVNVLERQWLLSAVASPNGESLADLWHQYIIEAGFAGGRHQAGEWLESLGYTGALPDMWAAMWAAGGPAAAADYWSDTLIAWEYWDNTGSPEDDEAGNYNATRQGGIQDFSGKPANFYCMYGTTANSWRKSADISELDVEGDFTIMHWHKSTSQVNGAYYRALQLGRDDNNQPLVDSFLTPPDHGTPNRYFFFLNQTHYISSPTTFDTSTARHIALTYKHSPGDWIMYDNGVQVASKLATPVTFDAIMKFMCGWYTTSTAQGRFAGCGYRLIQRTLTQPEIAGHYNNGDGLLYLGTPA